MAAALGAGNERMFRSPLVCDFTSDIRAVNTEGEPECVISSRGEISLQTGLAGTWSAPRLGGTHRAVGPLSVHGVAICQGSEMEAQQRFVSH